MNEELLNLVYRKGFAKLGTKESLVLPYVVTRYKEYCKQIINENSTLDLALLVQMASIYLHFLLQNPEIKIHVDKEP